jgi:hypothetical protein
MHRFLLLALFTVGCATTNDGAPPRAPWRNAPLSGAAVPSVYLEEWAKAENRATCAPIAPRSLGDHAHATPRRANFAGGWAVAYDLPDLRSAFGIAGAGVKAGDPTYDDWPYVWSWDEDGRAEFGPEAGVGPKQLAYVRIGGQGCLYNVWSNLGREHLESLLRELRMVRVD